MIRVDGYQARRPQASGALVYFSEISAYAV